MDTIKPRLHDTVDYLGIIILFLAPTVFGLTGAAAVIAYILAVVQTVLTLLSEFSLGTFSEIAEWLRTRSELVVAVALILIAILASFPEASNGGYFFAGLGLVFLISWFIASYQDPAYDRRTA